MRQRHPYVGGRHCRNAAPWPDRRAGTLGGLSPHHERRCRRLSRLCRHAVVIVMAASSRTAKPTITFFDHEINTCLFFSSIYQPKSDRDSVVGRHHDRSGSPSSQNQCLECRPFFFPIFLFFLIVEQSQEGGKRKTQNEKKNGCRSTLTAFSATPADWHEQEKIRVEKLKECRAMRKTKRMGSTTRGKKTRDSQTLECDSREKREKGEKQEKVRFIIEKNEVGRERETKRGERRDQQAGDVGLKALKVWPGVDM